MTTGMIDQDPAHDLRGDTKEVRPILPVDVPLVDEPQIRRPTRSLPSWRVAIRRSSA
jgi:hypothetical protein